jgi:peptidyl-dipeptidase Dcp
MTDDLLEHVPSAASGQAPLLRAWTGAYGGIPPFDGVRVDDFEPALDTAMAENLAEVDVVAGLTEPASFANTVEAMERTGRTLERVLAIYDVWRSNVSTAEFRAVERRMAPRLAALTDRITQNEALFRRIEAVYESPERARLTPEQQRLCWLYHTNFVHAGARLRAPDKERLSAINQRLATLFTEFNQNVLADEDTQWLTLEGEADLDGLPPKLVEAAAAAAAARGLPGRWVIANTRSSMEPFLSHSRRRDLRERGWRLWTQRADYTSAHDNTPVIAEILRLRAERAQLLGYETHAHWRLENTMAGVPARALELMHAVWERSTARVKDEVADMQAVAAAQGQQIRIEPWDYRYFAEQVRIAHLDLDQNLIKDYLQLDRIRDALFWVAGELFDLDFHEADDVPVFHPEVDVWQVTRRSTGEPVGLWYFDPFARPGKKSGAWMTAYRVQERFERPVTTLVSNNCNFVRGRAGEPVLISWDDAVTLFHEFGHALHGLCSAVMYPSLSGTAVPRDFVEFPSQLLEHWLSTPTVLQRFARHHETGEPLPQEIVKRIERAATFNQGFATTEYLASALIDMKLHLVAPDTIDVSAFERDTLAQLGMPRELVMRHRTPHFQHVFGGDAYSAGYYSYLWADALVADAFEAFLEADGPFDAVVAGRLRTHVLAGGNTVDPAEAYRRFRGRDAGTAALMRKRGFV